MSSQERDEIRRLRKENYELRRANANIKIRLRCERRPWNPTNHVSVKAGPAQPRVIDLPSYLRTMLQRIALRDIHYGDRHRRLNALYRMPDPWDMETERERFRFQETNRLIDRNVGRPGTLLEVGCGEGHQSQELLKTCDRLVGIDVSKRAVQRSAERCPHATFRVGDVLSCNPLERFDLVVACEVLYYMQDVASAIERISDLGQWCLVTYFDVHADRLDPYLEGIPEVESDSFHYGDTGWKAFWWRNANI